MNLDRKRIIIIVKCIILFSFLTVGIFLISCLYFKGLNLNYLFDLLTSEEFIIFLIFFYLFYFGLIVIIVLFLENYSRSKCSN